MVNNMNQTKTCLIGTAFCGAATVFNIYIGEVQGTIGWFVATIWTLTAANNVKGME